MEDEQITLHMSLKRALKKKKDMKKDRDKLISGDFNGSGTQSHSRDISLQHVDQVDFENEAGLENKKVVNLKNRMASILETYTPNMNQMIN